MSGKPRGEGMNKDATRFDFSLERTTLATAMEKPHRKAITLPTFFLSTGQP
jgi:hypothetical protein